MPTPRLVVVDDNDRSISYGQSWLQQGDRSVGNFGPSFKQSLHATSANTSFSTKFTGTSVTVLGSVGASGSQNPQWECILDNIALPAKPPGAGVIDNNWVLCEQPTLTDSEHSLVVNVITQGSTFWFDALRYTPSGSSDLSNAILMIDSSDPAMSFNAFADYGGFANGTNTQGATMQMDFIGKSFTWVGFVPKSSSTMATTATYAVDGGSPVAFPLNAPSTTASLYNQVFFTTPDLTPGHHSIVISYQGNGQTTPLILDYVFVANASSTNAPSTSPTTTSIPPPKKAAPIGAIVGGVIGGLLVTTALIVLALYLRKRSSSKHVSANLDVADGVVEVTPFARNSISSGYPSQYPYAPFHTTNPNAPSSTRAPQSSNGTPKGGAQTTASSQRLYLPSSKRQQAASDTTGNSSRVVHHEDSGLRLAQDTNEVTDVPPTYTAD